MAAMHVKGAVDVAPNFCSTAGKCKTTVLKTALGFEPPA